MITVKIALKATKNFCSWRFLESPSSDWHNLFLNFEQKWGSFSYKIVLISLKKRIRQNSVPVLWYAMTSYRSSVEKLKAVFGFIFGCIQHLDSCGWISLFWAVSEPVFLWNYSFKSVASTLQMRLQNPEIKHFMQIHHCLTLIN